MYGIAVEYAPASASALPDPLERAACRAVLVRQPGYRRRLALMGDGWRRVVDCFLFADGDAAPALLAHESAYGDLVVLLRSAPGPTGGGQGCWRDHLTNAEPAATGLD